jgi:hypothetical protein
MRRPAADHTACPWRVHALADDFELLDVWRYPVRLGREISLDEFLAFLSETQSEMRRGNGLAARLFRLRGWLGKFFGWDGDRSVPAEPGKREDGVERASLRQRLSADEQAELSSKETLAFGSDMGFEPVYALADETLAEIQNDTVHALMHLGRVASSPSEASASGDWTPQMAVYVKPRGLLGRAYMALIGPFRHLVVYPAMMRAVEQAWPVYAARREGA